MKYKLSILGILLISLVGCSNTNKIVSNTPPIVSITFDDGRKSVVENALPIMNKYNVNGTVYITTGFVNRIDHPSYMNYNDIRKMINNDWEIGAHSIYHQNLTELSSDSMMLNLIEPKELLENEFNIKIKSFASPYGEYNNELIDSVKTIYDNHLNAWSDDKGLNRLNDVNPYNIHRLDVTNKVSYKSVCKQIKKLQYGEWYVLLFHNVRNEIQGNWDTSVAKFEEIIKCTSKVKTKKVSEVLN